MILQSNFRIDITAFVPSAARAVSIRKFSTSRVQYGKKRTSLAFSFRIRHLILTGKADSSMILSEEGAGAVDIAEVLEDERLQKVDSCVADNAILLQKVDTHVVDAVVVLSEKDSDNCIVEVGESLITVEVNRNVVANVVNMKTLDDISLLVRVSIIARPSSTRCSILYSSNLNRINTPRNLPRGRLLHEALLRDARLFLLESALLRKIGIGLE